MSLRPGSCGETERRAAGLFLTLQPLPRFFTVRVTQAKNLWVIPDSSSLSQHTFKHQQFPWFGLPVTDPESGHFWPPPWPPLIPLPASLLSLPIPNHARHMPTPGPLHWLYLSLIQKAAPLTSIHMDGSLFLPFHHCREAYFKSTLHPTFQTLFILLYFLSIALSPSNIQFNILISLLLASVFLLLECKLLGAGIFSVLFPTICSQHLE